jgi:hypothetical protein
LKTEKKVKVTSKKKVSLKNYPRLDKSKTTRARKDIIDYDYLKQLSASELEFLNQFTDEFYCANFSGDTIHPKNLQKDCETRNNQRNNDLLTIKEITGGINFVNYGSELDELLENTVESAASREEVIEEIEDTILSLRILKKLAN